MPRSELKRGACRSLSSDRSNAVARHHSLRTPSPTEAREVYRRIWGLFDSSPRTLGVANRRYQDRVRVRCAGAHSRQGLFRDSSAGDRAAAMMGLPAGTRVRLAAGGTEMRKGFDKSGSTETSART